MSKGHMQRLSSTFLHHLQISRSPYSPLLASIVSHYCEREMTPSWLLLSRAFRFYLYLTLFFAVCVHWNYHVSHPGQLPQAAALPEPVPVDNLRVLIRDWSLLRNGGLSGLMYLSAYLSIHPSIHPSVRPSVRPSVCLPTYHLPTYLFIYVKMPLYTTS